MRKITKYLIGPIAGIGILTGSYFIGANKGYELGKQSTIEKLERVSNLDIKNCEHDINVYNTFKLYSDEDEIKRLEDLSKSTLNKLNTVKDLVQTVKNENVSFE